MKHLIVAPNGAKITPAEKAILCLLADDHREDPGLGYAWPSVGHLAKRACMTDVHCRRLLRGLEEKKVVESTPVLKPNGGRSSNRYRFPQIDPPFDKEHVRATTKGLQLQASMAAKRPVQMKLVPPNTDVGGGANIGVGRGRTSEFWGGEHRCWGGANIGVGEFFKGFFNGIFRGFFN